MHAIGAGNVIVEVQQNSDTTYRVFDWNRVGLDGKMRELHIGESMKSIDFADFEPGLQTPKGEALVDCSHFRVEKWELTGPRESASCGEFAIFTVLAGSVKCGEMEFQAGEFFLMPATMEDRMVKPVSGSASLLKVKG